jgi:hypothetical protein
MVEMGKSTNSVNLYELDLKKVLELLRSRWLFIVLFSIIVIFLFGAALVVLGDSDEYYSESIQYLPDMITTSVDIDIMPARVVSDNILFQVYEADNNPEKGSFTDYPDQFLSSVVHSDAISLKVIAKDIDEAKRIISLWQEVIDEEVIAPMLSTRLVVQNDKVDEKYSDYQQAVDDLQKYLIENGVEEKKQQIRELQILINSYSQQQVVQLSLKNNILTLKEDLKDLAESYLLSDAQRFLLENILIQFSANTMVVDTGQVLLSESVLQAPISNQVVIPLLADLESYVDGSLAFISDELLSASGKIAALKLEVEQDPRLSELEDLATYQKNQYLIAVDELEMITDEGYLISDSWGEPQISRWERISIIHILVIAVAAICGTIFIVIIQDWWKNL